MEKKGQADTAGMAIVVAFIVLAVIGVVQLVSVTITSKVSSNIEDNLELETLTTINETIAITAQDGSDNSTLLLKDGFIRNSESVANASNASEIANRGVDYNISIVGVSGETNARANFTWLTPSYNWSNTTGVFISYDTNEETDYFTTKDALVNDNLSSFELGGTAQIVFAASIIILAIFGILAIMRSK